MKKIIFLFALLLTTPTWALESVGQVVDFVEEAWVIHPDQKRIVVQFKDPIYEGDILETSKKGAVKILFQDDTLLTLKENSKILITKYLFDAKKGKRNAIFDIPFGKIRAIVGKFFGKDQPVTLKTPTAVAGIRGTDVAGVVEHNLTNFYCFDGSVETFNPQFPNQRVLLEEGRFIAIQEGKGAGLEDVMPIPSDVNRDREKLFDVTLSKKSHSAEVADRASEGESKEEERLKQTTQSQKTTGASASDQEVLPGGVSEVTEAIDIIITFPD